MTDKTEEQIAKERAAVEAMKNAKANMDHSLARIHTLEGGLRRALELLGSMKSHLPENAYVYNSCDSIRADFQKRVDIIAKVL